MTPDEAQSLAARILAAIDNDSRDYLGRAAQRTADRERIASDLAGLRLCSHFDGEPAKTCVRLFAEGLRRTARLYGVGVSS